MMNKVLLGCFLYVFPVFSGEHVERWPLIKAHEAVKRHQGGGHEGDAFVWNDLRIYIERKHKARAHELTLAEKNEQQRIKRLLVEDYALSSDDEDEDFECVLLCPRGVDLLR